MSTQAGTHTRNFMQLPARQETGPQGNIHRWAGSPLLRTPLIHRRKIRPLKDLYGLVLNLPNSLSGNAEDLSHLFKGQRRIPVETESPTDNLTLSRLELLR